MNDDELDSMLAKGALSGPERDRVFEQVWQRVRPAASHARGRLVAGGLLLLVAAAGAVLTVTARTRSNEAFLARGRSAADAPVDVVCTGGTLRACPHGSRLLFRSDRAGFLAAYAQPLNGGERIWYFSAGGEVPFVGSPAVSDRPAERAVVIGPEHTAGAYDLHVLIGSRPLSIAEALDPRASSVVASEVVRLDVTP